MNYQETTMLPNTILDEHLKNLTGKEIKILLVIVRQTLGWIDSKGNRKQRDWISQTYFVNKTGLSRKSVSMGIQLLISKRLILAESFRGIALENSMRRKKEKRIYYALHTDVWSKNYSAIHSKLRTTKLTQDKTKPIQKQSDRERLRDILQKMDSI